MSLNHFTSQFEPNPWMNPRMNSLVIDNKLQTLQAPSLWLARAANSFTDSKGPPITLTLTDPDVFATVSTGGNAGPPLGNKGGGQSAQGVQYNGIPLGLILAVRISATVTCSFSAIGQYYFGIGANGFYQNCLTSVIVTVGDLALQKQIPVVGCVDLVSDGVSPTVITIGVRGAAGSELTINSWSLITFQIDNYN